MLQSAPQLVAVAQQLSQPAPQAQGQPAVLQGRLAVGGAPLRKPCAVPEQPGLLMHAPQAQPRPVRAVLAASELNRAPQG